MIEGVRAGDALPSIEKRVDQERILAWAGVSGDFNRLHVDPEYAKKTPFKGTVAHGPMALAFLNQLMVECFGEGWILGGKLLDVRFVAPILPGDTITIGGSVKNVYHEGDGKFAECDLFIEKGDGEKAVVGRSIGRIVRGRS
jgi:3-hydroxybutyryl-CoA dehydratase